MDLIDPLNTLNLHQNQQAPLEIENFAALIQNHHTEFIFAHFQNSSTYIITQYGKIGNLYSVQTDLIDSEPVFSVKPLLGADCIEVEAGIRFIVEQLGIKKPLLVSLSLKDCGIEHLKLVVEAIRKYLLN